MPTAPLPWQHLAEEYRVLGRTADADRAAARAQQLVLAQPNRAKRRCKRRTRERARRFLRSNLAAEDASEIEKLPPPFERRELFQKQTHTVKIDDAVTDEEQIHPQDPIDSGIALL